MILPELDFKPAKLYGNELYLGPNRELSHVLAQDNPVYLDLILPGINPRPRVRVGFPEIGTTWVYADSVDTKAGLVGDVTDSHGPTFDPDLVYRFGMELKPWMFYCWLDAELKSLCSKRDVMVNYVVMACASGHAGVLIRITRGHEREALAGEWMEIYRFSTGNDFGFEAKWRDDPNTKLIARYVPREAGTLALHWVPEQLPA